MSESKNVFSPREAALYLGLAETTLRKGRVSGACSGRISPPPFVRLGRAIRYLKADLDAYLAAHRVTHLEKVTRVGQ